MEIFKKLASWLFLIGVIIAVIVGLLAQALWTPTYQEGVMQLQYPTYLTIALAVLGFVVGLVL